MQEEKIEILSVDLLNQRRQQVEALKHLAASLGLEFGWHYLLDLTWIVEGLGPVQGQRILDAGAGTGILQWRLAEEGAEVLSVDRGDRRDLPLRFRRRFRVAGLRPQDLAPARPFNPRRWRDLAALFDTRRAPGRVVFYHQDLKTLADIPDASLDAVAAVSALEHNDPQDLPQVVAELMRVLKPGGRLVATLCAARDEDWYHTPSAGWCYTAGSLRRLFSLPDGVGSNDDQYDRLMAALRECGELRDHLAGFYFRSGDNGMPWGKWDPQYQPVGVLKIK
jgi:ubiquinone/menaquinone biosynthesis C-methylase UbiE